MDGPPAIPCLHKGHILGSIKSVAVFFCAHLRTHTVLLVLVKPLSLPTKMVENIILAINRALHKEAI